MAKPTKTLTFADARPRIYLRAVSGGCEVAAAPTGPWERVFDVLDAIDHIAGDSAWQSPAVILWCGSEDA